MVCTAAWPSSLVGSRRLFGALLDTTSMRCSPSTGGRMRNPATVPTEPSSAVASITTSAQAEAIQYAAEQAWPPT
ncbi:hypothetical protein D3C84_1134970 [compost metagenome]